MVTYSWILTTRLGFNYFLIFLSLFLAILPLNPDLLHYILPFLLCKYLFNASLISEIGGFSAIRRTSQSLLSARSGLISFLLWVCVCVHACCRYEEQTVREGSFHTSTIRVVNVTAALDYAIFSCTARNSLGEDTLDIQLVSTSTSSLYLYGFCVYGCVSLGCNHAPLMRQLFMCSEKRNLVDMHLLDDSIGLWIVHLASDERECSHIVFSRQQWHFLKFQLNQMTLCWVEWSLMPNHWEWTTCFAFLQSFSCRFCLGDLART